MNPLEDALAAMEAAEAAKNRPRPLPIDSMPDVVQVLEKWVANGRKISNREVAQIISESFGVRITYDNVRTWLERHHAELVGRRGPG